MRHLINAFRNQNLIVTFFRDSSDVNVDVIYKILNLERFYDNKLNTVNKIELGEKDLYESLFFVGRLSKLKRN